MVEARFLITAHNPPPEAEGLVPLLPVHSKVTPIRHLLSFLPLHSNFKGFQINTTASNGRVNSHIGRDCTYSLQLDANAR